jgi:hypothetical protein
MQIFYPLLNYLSINPDYYDLVINEWTNNAKTEQKNTNDESPNFTNRKFRKSLFDGKFFSIIL